MFPRRTGLRALVLLWAALQLALPGVAALAEGLASRTSVHATAHVESSTERDCVRVHETDCVFCQLLSAGGTRAHGTATGLPTVALDDPLVPTSVDVAQTLLAPSASPRAPPAL